MNRARPTEPPVWFADAAEINPFQLLLDLHDQAVARTPGTGLDDVLTELALSAAVVSWWTRWQPSMIHTALRAGADLTDIAKAIGLDAIDFLRRWWRWADVRVMSDALWRRSLRTYRQQNSSLWR
ncbi:hypothetical protein ACLQ2S_15460 [Micromonospora sp. DT48]|uniref:hypothetical protein n=1 Tax=Micromonospora sp. DT48 TaxID=3393429 RepID=UPI003CF78DD4